MTWSGAARPIAIGIASAAIALLLQADSPAFAAATWESRQVEVGTRPGDGLYGVSCPTASSCVAVGNRGTVVTSANPGGGPEAWRSETVAPGPYVGTARGEADRTSPGSFDSVSCPTATMCAAVTYAGDFYVTGNLGGGASTWRATDLDGDGADTHLTGVSCPTTSFCLAVAAAGSGTEEADSGGKLFGIGDPLAAAISPVEVQLDRSLDLQAASCPSAALCLAVASRGRVVASADPAAADPDWREIGSPGGPGDLESIDCPATTLCLAGNARGNFLLSPDPSAAAPSWREANGGRSVPITGISCATVSRCAAVDNNGDVITSTEPTEPTGSWSARSLIPFPPGGSQGLPLNALFGVSCPSLGFCAAVGSRGLIFTSADPFDAADVGGERSGRGPRRPRMTILHGDHFARQSSTRGAGSRVTFRLRPYGRVRGFACSLDQRPFRRCRSPLRIYAKLGRHLLRARAIGMTGLRGPVARDRFVIRGPARGRF